MQTPLLYGGVFTFLLYNFINSLLIRVIIYIKIRVIFKK